jgi:hypothetical protein
MIKKIVAIVAILAAIIAVVVILQPSAPPKEEALPKLSINMSSRSGIAGHDAQLNITIKNQGGVAKGVSVALSCDAFGNVTSVPVDVPSNQTIFAVIPAKIKDLPNGEYDVKISYSYTNIIELSNDTRARFYVIPFLEIVDVHWKKIDVWPLPYEKNTIEVNGTTELYFKVHSGSDYSIYARILASTELKLSPQGLTITPITLNVEDIGPTGTTHSEYIFKIESKNTPTGKYKITIIISSDNYVAATSVSEIIIV